MRLGILGSTGGSAAIEALAIAEVVWPGRWSPVVVADRDCGLLDHAVRAGWPNRRVEGDNAAVSCAAEWFFAKHEVDLVVLFYTRLVDAVLFERRPTFNLHPSLLPAYRGLSAIARAQRDGALFLGATLHLVDGSIDGGAIVAQTVMPLRGHPRRVTLEKLSFVQKVALVIVLLELWFDGRLEVDARSGELRVDRELQVSDRCVPRVRDEKAWDALQRLQRRESVEVLG